MIEEWTKKEVAYIQCRQCDRLIEAERTHNGISECWLGHCCGFGQDAAIGEEVYMSKREVTKNR